MPEKDCRQSGADITITDLYPDLPSEEQEKAEYRLLRYLTVVKRIFERIAQENPKLLTELERRAMLRKKLQKRSEKDRG